ncbi:uncharacterized protein STEHIDRAFT_160547 [Stereum hirsutum FP-91666 SS1]|uniref:uncharacterized protein n=1 Tax=Stereum hirsutum (strain FP-91666) TaxID=721885 RepID=UPI00044494B7|nr:uncharacterized protein STEHIDRAFT_160547 [Stereum hirsutum FP-91666 SS1]EIM82931.1 hypothetical protein STEHIDRAFT_160547 [Stereum hirsutum FP-91666 SS1]
MARDMFTSSRPSIVSPNLPPPVYPSDAGPLQPSAIAPSPSCSILPISPTSNLVRYTPPSEGHAIPNSPSQMEPGSSSSITVLHIFSQDAANDIAETSVSVDLSVLQSLSTSQSATFNTASRPRLPLDRGFSDDTVIALEAYYPDAPDSVRRRMSTGYANYPGSYGGYGGMSESQSRRTVPFDEEDGDPELPTYVEEDKLASSRMVQLLQDFGTEGRAESTLRESQSLQ